MNVGYIFIPIWKRVLFENVVLQESNLLAIPCTRTLKRNAFSLRNGRCVLLVLILRCYQFFLLLSKYSWTGSVAILTRHTGQSPINWGKIFFENFFFNLKSNNSNVSTPYDQHTALGFFLVNLQKCITVAIYFVILTLVPAYFMGICFYIEAICNDFETAILDLNNSKSIGPDATRATLISVVNLQIYAAK